MKKTGIITTLVIGSLISTFASASEETKYVRDQTAQGNASDMASRSLLQLEVMTAIDFSPLVGLLVYTTSTALLPEMNIVDLDLITQQRYAKLRDALQEGFGLTSEGTSRVSAVLNDSINEARQAFAKKIKEEKSAFYANGKVDVAQTPTLFRAVNEVAQVKGVDANQAAEVIINNSEIILENK